MDVVDLLLPLERPFKSICPIPDDPASLTDGGDETPAGEVGVDPGAVSRVWQATLGLYRTGLYPAVQICIRRRGRVVLHRAVGYASGGGPDAEPGEPRVPVSIDTPFLLYSASKAMAAMVIHKLDEQNKLHLDDRVCDTIPEFGKHGKQWITIRHLLAHSAGIPNLPPEAMDLDLLSDPDRICDLMCELETSHGPGRRLAYHAVSGGFVLGELVRRITGQDMRAVMQKEVCDPLGFRWMNFGVHPRDVPLVARDSVTGLPILPPVSWLLRRALGASFQEVVRLANDPRFLTGVIPAANLVSNAAELCAFYQCLLNGGELDGEQIFAPRTVAHACSEQSYLEIDLTLGMPLRYGLGMMLGGRNVGLWGLKTPRAFGHLGFTNIFAWADPDRDLSVALITSGKPLVSIDSLRLLEWILSVGRAFPPV